jgi:hypothetical protein
MSIAFDRRESGAYSAPAIVAGKAICRQKDVMIDYSIAL